jgi:hypothetical protein
LAQPLDHRVTRDDRLIGRIGHVGTRSAIERKGVDRVIERLGYRADLRRLLKKLLAQFDHPDHQDCPRSTQLGKRVRPGTNRAASDCSQCGSALASEQRAERAAVLKANTRSDRIRR